MHGIRDGDLVEAPAFAAVAAQLDTLFAGWVLVAHNAGFDAAMLGEHRSWPTVCTRAAADALGLSATTLPEVMRELGVERAGRAHRAGSDAEAAALVWWRLLNLARAPRARPVARYRHHETMGIMSGREAQAPRERPTGWLLPSFFAALAGGVVVAADSVVALPVWVVLTALVAIVFGVVVFGVNVWREARADGTGLLRTSGRALWRSLRLLVSTLFS